MKVTVSKTYDIHKCYHTCPYFGMAVGVMICSHPDAKNAYIITYPECDAGFPKECPLLNIKKILKIELWWGPHTVNPKWKCLLKCGHEKYIRNTGMIPERTQYCRLCAIKIRPKRERFDHCIE
jgi:hypothetical protein